MKPLRRHVTFVSFFFVFLISGISLGSNFYPNPYYLVTDFSSGTIRAYDATLGTFIGIFAGGLQQPVEMSIGPDGLLYVSEQLGNRISRFNPLTAQSLPAFANQNLATPRGLDWGPNGDLYVASANGNRVVELNGATGNFVQNFIPSIGGSDHFALWLGWIVIRGSWPFYAEYPSSIDRFNATTGAIIDHFVTSNINTPQDMLFGPGGGIYVTNQISQPQLDRFSGGLMGGLDNSFVLRAECQNPQGILFGPNGALLVADGGNRIREFDATTGSFLGNLINDPNLIAAGDVIYVPEPSTILLLCCGLGFILIGEQLQIVNDEPLEYPPSWNLISDSRKSSTHNEPICTGMGVA